MKQHSAASRPLTSALMSTAAVLPVTWRSWRRGSSHYEGIQEARTKTSQGGLDVELDFSHA